MKVYESECGKVTKFVFEWEDAAVPAVAETVLYRYPDYRTRTVICVSVQSGCPVGCVFCGTGKNFVRDLKCEEILEQINGALCHTGEEPVTIQRLQIMFMSMGEPMLNWGEVIRAIRSLRRWIPYRTELLISTVGLATPDWSGVLDDMAVYRLGLQFSVHASTDKGRARLIPDSRLLSLGEIAGLGRSFYELTRRHPVFNYCVMGGVNNSVEDAHRLRERFHPDLWRPTVSVICPKCPTYRRQTTEECEAFRRKLENVGYTVRVFNPSGQDDIGGGCGQLWYVQRWFREQQEKSNGD